MSFWSTVKSIGSAFGLGPEHVEPVGCTIGRGIYREAKRSTQLVNAHRPWRRLRPDTQEMLRTLFPDLDVERIRYRTRCRLPSNRFRESGSIYAMTFGYSIYWRGDFDERNPRQIVDFIHEVMHVEQVRRFGGEDAFACEYGKGYLQGGGELPATIRKPSTYHRNPLEAEAYRFEATFQDATGAAVADRIPWPDH